MLRSIAKFEVKYHLKAPLFYILFAVYFLLSFAAVASNDVVSGSAISAINKNAPFLTMLFMLLMSIFGVLTTTAFVADSVHRDFDLGTDSLFFSAPITKWQYLLGRFIGSLSVAVLIYVGVAVAMFVASLMPWIDQERIGPTDLWSYVFSLFALVIPNLLLCGAIFFAVAALTRSVMATYSSVVAFFVAWGVAGALLEDMENERISALLDPFGANAFFVATRYWTIFDKNNKLLPLEGVFLWNRILWVGIALTVLAFACWRFKFTTGTRKSAKKARRNAAAEAPLELDRTPVALPPVQQTFGGAASWKAFIAATRRECLTVFKSIPFVIIVALGVANIWGNSVGIDSVFGTSFYPVTHKMITGIMEAFAVLALLIATFYAGDIVWRERSLKMHEVYDAMPTPTWAIWASKATALVLVVFAALAIATLTSILIQLGNGYTNLELGLYAKGVLLQIGSWLVLLAALSFLLQVFINQKFIGFAGVMAWYIIMRILPAVGWEHRLYRYASIPPFQYSDMNGYGHFARPLFWFTAYWMFLVIALMAVAHLMWVRGTAGGFRQRLNIARQRFGRPVAVVMALFFTAFVATGCFIYYNTNVLNDYRTSDETEKLQAEFEKKYKRFENLPQPRITKVKADVAIYPERREVAIRGNYELLNRTQQPIPELHISADPRLTTMQVQVAGAKLKQADEELGYWIYTLAQPLAPGASMTITYDTGWKAAGFVNGTSNTNVVENGTFFNNSDMFPRLGYTEGLELQDRADRRKYGLGPIERMQPATNMQARMNNQISRDADWIDLDTTVSTSADQTALAPGYLQRTWTENGRRYFHYKTTSPILAFWSYLSARYEVKRDQWNGIPIEIYYDKKHHYNVDRMIDATKKSLTYFTKNFGPYQHKQVRILEFPGYARFAQSFPNTIPFSENIGFIADLRDKESLDYVFYVTSHEIAHQWWAHQVIGGNVQGSTLIVETMAQYSALMVMEQEYGREKMQRFLSYELDRYLGGRGTEIIAEKPLISVENQGYIHYRKGAMVMYALRDAIGEEAVNRGLAKFIRDYRFAGPPYTTGAELVRYLRAEAGPQHQELITDLFERIVLFDNQTRTVTSTKRADGKYVVKLTVASTKLRGDEKGEEKPVPVNDLMDIGVFGEKEKVLFSEKRRITKPVETFEIVVSEKPVKAGIDPFNKLIDRNPKDNTKSF